MTEDIREALSRIQQHAGHAIDRAYRIGGLIGFLWGVVVGIVLGIVL